MKIIIYIICWQSNGHKIFTICIASHYVYQSFLETAFVWASVFGRHRPVFELNGVCMREFLTARMPLRMSREVLSLDSKSVNLDWKKNNSFDAFCILQFINLSTTEFNSSLNPAVSHAFGHNLPLKAQTLQVFDALFCQGAFCCT